MLKLIHAFGVVLVAEVVDGDLPPLQQVGGLLSNGLPVGWLVTSVDLQSARDFTLL